MALPMQSSSGPIDTNEPYPVGRAYAWLVFAMTFGLMLSDYISRQVGFFFQAGMAPSGVGARKGEFPSRKHQTEPFP